MLNELYDSHRITVVIPVYNREKTIKRCIDSVVGQTFAPYEIIAVDDGSTDQTLVILENMSYDKLRVIRQNHRGAQAARNLGIINAKGNYIAFLDSDDEWLPEMLEEEVACLLNKKDDCVIYSDCYKNNGHKRIWKLPDCTANSYASALKHGGPMFQSLLVKKEWLLEMGLLDEKVPAYQEWDATICLAKRKRFFHIRKPLFIYYLHDGETISKDRNKGVAGYLYILNKHEGDILKIHGIGMLNRHYKMLLESCLKNKNRKAVYILFRMLCVNARILLKFY